MSKKIVRRLWNDNEVNFLLNKWDVYTLKRLSKELDRSVGSIQNKARSLGFENHLISGEYISISEIYKTIYNKKSDSRTVCRWINKGLKFYYRPIINKKVKCTKMPLFWKWAEKNQSILNFSRFEENSLGREPKWVKIKRRNDINSIHLNRPWNKIEDIRLKKYLNDFKYTYKDLASIFDRSELSIKGRISQLNLKERPVISNRIKWNDDDDKLLGEYINNRLNVRIISEKLNRSEKSIRSRIFEFYLTENIDKAAEILNGSSFGDNRPVGAIIKNGSKNNKDDLKKINNDINCFISILKKIIMEK